MFYEDIDMGEVNQIRISGPELVLFGFFLHLIIRFTIEIKLKYQVIGPMKTLICVKMSLNTEVGFLDQLDHSFLIQFYAPVWTFLSLVFKQLAQDCWVLIFL